MPNSRNTAKELNVRGLALCENVWSTPDLWEKNHALAIATFKEAIRADSSYAPAQINLGAALCNLGRHAAAVEVLQKVKDQGSQDRNLLFNLAVAKMNSGSEGRKLAPELFRFAATLPRSEETFEAYFDPLGY